MRKEIEAQDALKYEKKLTDKRLARLKTLVRSLACVGMFGLSVLNPSPSRAEINDTFNVYIIRALEQLNAQYGGKGKDISADYTHDIEYGGGTIKARKPPLSGCTAIIAEVIATAINLYVHETQDSKPYRHLPPEGWNRMRPMDIRSHIWVDPRLDSYGTADALVTFGVGKRSRFGELTPGSFVNFNRINMTGHAVIFIGYLDESGKELSMDPPPPLDKIAGFKYFSAQSSTNGLGFRYAFFSNKDGKSFCPKLPSGLKADCGVKYSASQKLLNTGYMLAPHLWDENQRDDNVRELLDRLQALAATRGSNASGLPKNLSRLEFLKSLYESDTMVLNPIYKNE